MMRFALGLLLGLLIVPVAVVVYLKYGNPAVATADPALPFERQIVSVPMQARIRRELAKTVPIAADAATFAAGAAVYRKQCAACHGLPGRPSPFAQSMFPEAPQLFVRHGDHVGVSDDEPAETYWKVANGIRLSGMPAFRKILDDKAQWQVTLLLANADKLPPAVEQLLAGPDGK